MQAWTQMSSVNQIFEPLSQATKYHDKKHILNKDHECLRRIRSHGRTSDNFSFEDKREQIAKVNIPNIAYPN